MSIECSEYRREKQKSGDSSQLTSKEDDEVQHQFLKIAAEGSAIKSRCLSILKEVIRCWGADIVRHYQFASRGEKYCNQLRRAVRMVPVWDEARIGLTLSMLKRSRDVRRQPPRVSVNPIEQVDLQSLGAWSPKDSSPCKRLTTEDLPDGFGFDKFGLMVHKEHAVAFPEPDSNGATEPTSLEVNNADTSTAPSRQNGSADLQRSAALEEPGQTGPDDDIITEVIVAEPASVANDQPSTDSAEDTAATPETLPHSPDSAHTTPDKSTGMTLRSRASLSYRAPPGGGGRSKPKQAGLQSVKPSKIPPRCCPAEVPSTLLSALDGSVHVRTGGGTAVPSFPRKTLPCTPSALRQANVSYCLRPKAHGR